MTVAVTVTTVPAVKVVPGADDRGPEPLAVWPLLSGLLAETTNPLALTWRPAQSGLANSVVGQATETPMIEARPVSVTCTTSSPVFPPVPDRAKAPDAVIVPPVIEPRLRYPLK